MTLSIIIVNYNSKDVLKNCLSSLTVLNSKINFEVIIIDNASSEGIDELESVFPQYKFLYNDKNIGFAAANNIGIKQATSKFILLLNPDTIVNANSFRPMIDYLESYDDVAIVGCKIFNADGAIERSTHSFPSLLKEFVHANEFLKILMSYDSLISSFLRKNLKAKSLESYWDHNSTKQVDHVTGACMMIKKEAIDKVGLLDEAFFLYNEEVEWSLRFKSAGYKSVFVPDSSIIHLFGYSTKQRVQKQTVNNLLVERYRGMFYFFQKHYGSTKLFILRIIVFEGFTVRFFSSFIKSIFTSSELKQIYKNERTCIKKIISLSINREFDW
jgi:GT2 family glycosyltransferase